MARGRRTEREEESSKRQLPISKEIIITSLGVVIVIFELVNAEFLGRTFHYEFLILAAGCLGLAIAGWGDKKSK